MKDINPLALHFLAGSSSIKALDAAKKLLDTGLFNVNEKDDDWKLTPLHIASNWGNLSMVQLLIHYGGNPLEKDDDNQTCIDLTDDLRILKFYQNFMDDKEPKKKFKMMKIIKELFGLKKNDYEKKKINERKKRRPVSCFASFEEIKNFEGKKRRSERLKSEFKILTDEEVNELLAKFNDDFDENENEKKISITNSVPILPMKGKEMPLGMTKSSSNVVNHSGSSSNVQNLFSNVSKSQQMPVIPHSLPNNQGLPSNSPANVPETNDLIQRIEKMNLESKSNINDGNGSKTNMEETSNDKKKEKITAIAQTLDGEEFEFEFYQTISSSLSFKEEMNSSIYPNLLQFDDDGVVNGCNVENDDILPPPRTTSLNENYDTPKFSRICKFKQLSDENKMPWTPSEDLPTLPSTPKSNNMNNLPIPPKRIESTRDYIKTPTAPLESDHDEEEKNEYKSPLPETPDIPIEIRKLPLIELKRRLKIVGISPGPMLGDNRKYYEKKLVAIETQRLEVYEGKVYSTSLDKFIKKIEKNETTKVGILQEDIIRNEFCSGQVITREKNEISSFCYLLIDPSMIKDQSNCNFKEFLEAVFYIGKGKRSRPLQHLIDAAKSKRTESLKGKPVSDKLKRICRLWRKGHGVISLSIFHNIHPNEAYIREASMIDAYGLSNLTNLKCGEYSGISKSWSLKEKTDFGSLCLHSAWRIFLHERCRPVFENDVSDAINLPKLFYR